MKTINNYTFFWKDKIGQWNLKSFIDDDGITYNCAEQYMMAKKAQLFNDLETYSLIMKELNPAKHQKLGRLIKNFNEDTWIQHREEIVYQGNIYKFTQNKELKEVLLSTGTTILVEASPYDKIWGVGLSVNDPLILDQKNWRGLNLLGKILSRVRKKIS
jgi:ribA/ribD-fused uncharacterized protein